jgi:hypothetical protein
MDLGAPEGADLGAPEEVELEQERSQRSVSTHFLVPPAHCTLRTLADLVPPAIEN